MKHNDECASNFDNVECNCRVSKSPQIFADIAHGKDPDWIVDIRDEIGGMPIEEHTDGTDWAVDLLCKYVLMRDQLAAVQAERDAWKANHDEMVARNTLLRARTDMPMERLREYNAFMVRYDALKARAEGAEGIVAKLPKTADGVSVTLDDEVWHPEQINGWKCRVYWSDGDYAVTVATSRGPDNFINQSYEARVDECYSTEAAALAALAAKGA